MKKITKNFSRKYNKNVLLIGFRIIMLRGLSVLIAGLSSILAIKVFLSMDATSSATFMAILGWTIFLPLFQFGLGRPCYAELRQEFLSNKLTENIAQRWLCIFKRLAITGSIVFSIASILIAKILNYDQDYFLLFSFSLALASFSVCFFLRDISYALGNEFSYEIMEVFRRLSLAVFYIFLYLKCASGFYALMLIPIAILSWSYTAKKIIEINNLLYNYKSIKSNNIIINSKIKSNAKKYFGFSVNELILYNIPLIIFTIFPNKENIVYFGVWSKFFLILVIAPRIFIDSMMNAITKKLNSIKKSEAFKNLNAIFFASIAIGLVMLILCYLNKQKIYRWISLPEFIENNFYFLPSLLMWTLGNIIQHCYGSFTLSRSDGFGHAFRISVVSVFAIFLSMAVTYYFSTNIGLSIFLSGVVYCFCSLLYIATTKIYFADLKHAT